jgi:glucan phosphoethanolaminetransferase (alkaline phosphatase superfamily)
MELSRGYVLLYIFILLAFLGIFIFLALRLPAKISTRKSLTTSMPALVMLLILPFMQNNGLSYTEGFKDAFVNTFPCSFAYNASKVYSLYKKVRTDAPIRDKFQFHAKQINPPGTRQLYILIIGESGRAGEWAINGYHRNTSPRISKRLNLVTFSNTVAGGNFTEYAVPQIVSQATPDNFELQYREKCIVSAFKEAGFKTYWLSNNLDDGTIQIHANEADEVVLNLGNNPLDMDMVTRELTRVLAKKEDRVFVIIHTIGSHWAYTERYPPAFKVFTPVINNVGIYRSESRKKDFLINAYDNSILYCDATIDTVISITAKENACSTVFYISDHGEDLMDDSRERLTHGSDPPSVFVAHIPFFVWYSDNYKELFPDRISWLQMHKDRKTGTENVFPSLAQMASLSFPGLDTSKSILSASFKDSQQKILGNNSKVYLYDSLYKE